MMPAVIGEKAPNLRLSEWVQGIPTNFDQEKDHIVIVEVFQVNCPGCFLYGIPEAISVYEKYSSEGVRVIGVATAFEDYDIRTRATCILVDFGGEDKVSHIAKILKDDPNELVRHEAAFSLGQMCHPSGIAPLAESTRSDSSMFVRHEAAIALGVIGSKDAKDALNDALQDSDKPVVDSAIVALSNIEFMETIGTNEKFAKLTGG